MVRKTHRYGGYELVHNFETDTVTFYFKGYWVGAVDSHRASELEKHSRYRNSWEELVRHARTIIIKESMEKR